MGTITKYAEENGIEYNKFENIYFTFLEMGYIWFTDSLIVAQEELTINQEKAIENYIDKKIATVGVIIRQKQKETRSK